MNDLHPLKKKKFRPVRIADAIETLGWDGGSGGFPNLSLPLEGNEGEAKTTLFLSHTISSW